MQDTRIFCKFEEAFLPQVAAQLLEETGGQLGQHIVVVRGRAAGRRLLFLLAQGCSCLIPPRIVTLDSLVREMGISLPSPVLARLAWAFVMREASDDTLQKIWKFPASQKNALTRSLADFLAKTSRELDAAGWDFGSAANRLSETLEAMGEGYPERWHELHGLQDRSAELLSEWGFSSPIEAWKNAQWDTNKKLCLIGTVELPRVFSNFFESNRVPSQIFIHANESHNAGFDKWGRLDISYWKEHSYLVRDEHILTASDTVGQVNAVAECIEQWRAVGIAPEAVTLALPDASITADFELGLAELGIVARAAGGHSLARGEVTSLLDSLAEVCESPKSYRPLAQLLRQPQVQTWLGESFVVALDKYFIEHLPEKITVTAPAPLQAALDKIADACAALRAGSLPQDLRILLLEIFEKKESLHRERDRALLEGLQTAIAALEQIEILPKKILEMFSVTELLREVSAVVAQSSTPEFENPQAIEIAGWLEASLDDAPAMIVASVYDGCLPETVASEPLLHDALREQLGLPCRASRYARDQYTLSSIASPRGEFFRMIAPQHDSKGTPARPSRLLLAGLQGKNLAHRVLLLMG